MPIYCPVTVRSLSTEEFRTLSYDLMSDVFKVRNELGRFFDERIYKLALARRRADVALEVPVEISFHSFTKRYFLDVLTASGGVFEFKATESLTRRHQAQLLNQLFLLNLRHGLLVNLRPVNVTKEFVNATLTADERRNIPVSDGDWVNSTPGAKSLRETLHLLIQEWGIGLELSLYEDALTHFLGGAPTVIRRISVYFNGQAIAEQPLRMAHDRVAFKLTALESENELHLFVCHARRLIAHTGIQALLWVNLARRDITNTTLSPA